LREQFGNASPIGRLSGVVVGVAGVGGCDHRSFAGAGDEGPVVMTSLNTASPNSWRAVATGMGPSPVISHNSPSPVLPRWRAVRSAQINPGYRTPGRRCFVSAAGWSTALTNASNP
jgi:hypothetical protein